MMNAVTKARAQQLPSRAHSAPSQTGKPSSGSPTGGPRRGARGEHVLGDPLPGRYPWSQTFVCSCGARLLSPEIAQLHLKNFNKSS
ncbi:hypothetical protein QOT17_003125 [Balamuthia mandrillaris]